MKRCFCRNAKNAILFHDMEFAEKVKSNQRDSHVRDILRKNKYEAA